MAKIYGTNNLDFINFSNGATDGDDTIYGYGGGDWLSGWDGNDTLVGGEGADYLFGGNGIDTANYGDSPTGVFINMSAGVAFGGTAEGDHLSSIENLIGSWFNDVLVGNDYGNVLSGVGGDDILVGLGGADILDGGWGVDTAGYGESPAGVSVCLFWHSASGGDATGDQLFSIENLEGSHFSDNLFGDDGPNELLGLGGDDTLLGLGGDDNLSGGDGNDTLNGGAGQDILTGGPGADTLSGGYDADTFVWNNFDGAGVSPSGDIDLSGMDTILDFQRLDKIDVQGVDADVYALGDQAFTFIGDYFAHGGFTAPGQVAYTKDATDTYLIFNTDNVYTINTAAEFEFAIKLHGNYTPEASWFVHL